MIGHNLGLYKALAAEPATADAAADSYSMTEEQAFALTNPDGGIYAPGAFGGR